MRLDAYLVTHGLIRSRERAKAVVKAGRVQVNGVVASKVNKTIALTDDVRCAGDIHDYVSRAALKLLKGLDDFGVDPANQICLDLGASTGGFTQVLLERDAAKVYAVDVGTDQLANAIRNDPRVVCLEKTHAKLVSASLIPDPIDLLVCDVSFISIMKALPIPLRLCAHDATLITLVKPQFELSRMFIGKGGVVSMSLTDQWDWLHVAIVPWLAMVGWSVTGIIESPITGGDGNLEFLLKAESNGA